MQYLTVAEAYRDLERASGRLALVDRLAALLAGTPAGLLRPPGTSGSCRRCVPR